MKLNLTEADRGKELTADEVRSRFDGFHLYRVRTEQQWHKESGITYQAGMTFG